MGDWNGRIKWQVVGKMRKGMGYRKGQLNIGPFERSHGNLIQKNPLKVYKHMKDI